VRRREFITLLVGATTWPLAAHAQPSARRPTLGLLIPGSAASYGQRVAALVQRLRELGWVEGRTIAIEYRWAATQRFDEIAAEFVRTRLGARAGAAPETEGPPLVRAAPLGRSPRGLV
jgi:putative tryptophan/tyrosine transport system substrate-binding protein